MLANRPAGEQKCQLASPIQGLDEIVPIHTIQKNIFAPVSPAHDMIHGAGIFNTSVAGHEYNPMAEDHRRQPENKPYYGLTPFVVLALGGLGLRRWRDGAGEGLGDFLVLGVRFRNFE
jgi:hypothetical protein